MNKINRIIEFNRLASIAVPEKTNTYKPISYLELDNLCRDEIEKSGFQLKNTQYLTACEGLEAAGTYNINYGEDKEMGLQIGWQNSYDKKIPLRFACGGFIFLCTNGVMIGELGLFKSKHQGEIQSIAPGSITEIIKNSGNLFQKMITDREKMKEIGVTKKTCAELIGRLYIDEKIINNTQLGIIKREIENPSFIYGENKKSLWQLYNNCTLAFRTDHPAHYMDRHISTHKFFAKEFSI
jgi:hypothetical protein